MAVVLFAGPLVAEIPLAALAGVLMVTAVRMVEIHNVRAVLRSTRTDAIVLVLTATATIAFDLIVAVEIGIAVAALFALRAVAAHRASATAVPLSDGPTLDGDDRARAASTPASSPTGSTGPLFFGAAQRFLTELTAVSDVRVVILRLPDMQVLDATGAQALGEIVAELEHRHVTVLLKGPRPEHLQDPRRGRRARRARAREPPLHRPRRGRGPRPRARGPLPIVRRGVTGDTGLRTLSR